MSATPRSASYATSGLGEPIVAARPSGVQADDLLIAVYSCDGSLTGSGASGWTAVTSYTLGGELSVRVYRRKAGTAEPSSYTFTQRPGSSGTVHVVRVSGAVTSTHPKVAIDDSFGQSIVAPTVQPASAVAAEIRVGLWPPFGDATLSPPSGYTARGLVASSEGTVQSCAATRQVSSSTASGPKSFLISASGLFTGIGVSISVASLETAPPVDPPPPLTPGRGTSQYRYVLKDWGGTYLDDLELSGVRFDKRILQAGTFGATIPIPNAAIAQRVARVIPRDQEGEGGITDLSIGPGVITCEIYRDGAAWGEYWITAAKTTRSRGSTPQIQLRGSTMDAYLLHVEIQELLEYAGIDQIDIARSLLESVQALPHADLNLVMQTGTSGVLRDHTYKADESTYGQRLVELAQLNDGFEWTINHVLGTGLERHWVWGYPTLGSGEVSHVFVDSPGGGDILDWDEEIDALRGGTRWRARGGTDPAQAADASTSSTPLMSSAVEAAAHLAAGWPRLDRTLNYSSVIVQQTLEDYAAYWAATAAGALRVDSVTVALGSEPTFTPNSLGDQARLYFENEWHLPHSRVRRIIGVGITPTSKQSGKEEAQLIFEGLEVAP